MKDFLDRLLDRIRQLVAPPAPAPVPVPVRQRPRR